MSVAAVLAVVLWAVAARGADAPPSPLFATAGESVVAATPVPSPDRRVGEVRLLRRGAAAVVQTVLDTALLRRVVAEIRKKEEPNWPVGRPGHDDSLRYLAALDQVADQIRARRPTDPRRTRRRLHLLIEFALAEKDAAVSISGWRIDDGHVARIDPIVVLQPSRAYVAANMRLIAADSFQADGAALDTLLAPLKPPL
jgi:hypothetical protein